MIESRTPAGKKSVFTKQLEENFSIEHPIFILTVLSDIQIAVRSRTTTPPAAVPDPWFSPRKRPSIPSVPAVPNKNSPGKPGPGAATPAYTSVLSPNSAVAELGVVRRLCALAPKRSRGYAVGHDSTSRTRFCSSVQALRPGAGCFRFASPRRTRFRAALDRGILNHPKPTCRFGRRGASRVRGWADSTNGLGA